MLLNDVTLREGDQMPGSDYSVEEKIEAGRALDDLNVSSIQTGFPITGERDREATRRLTAEVSAETIGLARVVTNDIGVAVANTLAAYETGVAKADVSVASLGERAGNTSLEEVVVAGVTNHDEDFGIETEKLIPACERVLDTLGESIGSRKPVLGKAVTTHESGLHTAAMLNDPSVYEPFAPPRFGGERHLLFGSGTGRSSACTLLERADVEPTDERIDELLSALQQKGPLELEEAVTLAGEF